MYKNRYSLYVWWFRWVVQMCGTLWLKDEGMEGAMQCPQWLGISSPGLDGIASSANCTGAKRAGGG